MLTEDVKTALRISHTKLDDDISKKIESAKAEMVRLGVSLSKANDESDPLISEAIITYVRRDYEEDPVKNEMFTKSWESQVDGLRKSTGYADV